MRNNLDTIPWPSDDDDDEKIHYIRAIERHSLTSKTHLISEWSL